MTRSTWDLLDKRYRRAGRGHPLDRIRPPFNTLTSSLALLFVQSTRYTRGMFGTSSTVEEPEGLLALADVSGALTSL